MLLQQTARGHCGGGTIGANATAQVWFVLASTKGSEKGVCLGDGGAGAQVEPSNEFV